MRIYLASRYSRREELCGYRTFLEAAGHSVTSRWLNGKHQIANDGAPIGDDGEALVEHGQGAKAHALRMMFAEEDLEDVRVADLVVCFTEQPRSGHSRGGRHVEFGYALGLGKKIAVVGPRENLFCWCEEIIHFDTWEEAKAMWPLSDK